MAKAASVIVWALALALALAANPPAFAKGGGHAYGSSDKFAPGFPPGFSKGKKVGWHGSHRPPGWSHGKKEGWDGKSEPPGLRRH